MQEMCWKNLGVERSSFYMMRMVTNDFVCVCLSVCLSVSHNPWIFSAIFPTFLKGHKPLDSTQSQSTLVDKLISLPFALFTSVFICLLFSLLQSLQSTSASSAPLFTFSARVLSLDSVCQICCEEPSENN